MSDGQVVPMGVKIITILYYIGAVIGVLFGLLLLFGAGMMGTLLSEMPFLGALGASFFVFAGIFALCLSALSFFIGRGLWNAKSWARIVAIIFACFGILTSLTGLMQGDLASIFGILIQLFVGGYLFFNTRVKKAFA